MEGTFLAQFLSLITPRVKGSFLPGVLRAPLLNHRRRSSPQIGLSMAEMKTLSNPDTAGEPTNPGRLPSRSRASDLAALLAPAKLET